MPRLEQSDPINESDILTKEYFCTLSDVKFRIFNAAFSAILSNIPHRAFYRAGEDTLAAIELA